MQKRKELIKHELIGRIIKIIDSTNKANIGLNGKVLDETKHLLIIDTSKGIKKVSKKGNIFQIQYLGEKVNINGELLFGAPAERIKTKVKNENTR
ncbi:ribonuclease P protein subunit [Candidatus Woesearchaeota archaeon]|nr:ribonuclease P protein subunit [Candidatus Woesearchaeota archaeon]MBW2993908.1 ribonuclease P protein subunit [Candidatus Woesearchaeota archaeon]